MGQAHPSGLDVRLEENQRTSLEGKAENGTWVKSTGMNRTEKKNERARETAWANKPSPGSAELHKGWFLITLLYLVIDYGRPQEFLPIGFLRPSLLCVSALTLCLVANSVWGQLRSKQVTLILLFEGLLIVLIPVARNNMAAFQTAQLMLVYLPFIFSTIVCVDSLQRMRTMINLLILLMIHQGVYSIFHGGKGAGSVRQPNDPLALRRVLVHEDMTRKESLFAVRMFLCGG